MKPIIFNTEMVKAILDGRKTQFREVVKTVPKMSEIGLKKDFLEILIKNSKYKVGDILYVKEKCVDEYPNGFCFIQDYELEDWKDKNLIKEWCSQFNARIFLKVTSVRVERLQDITIEDMICEGINHLQEYSTGKVVKPSTQIKREFVNLWNSTAKDGYKYLDNPDVFVHELERVEQ